MLAKVWRPVIIAAVFVFAGYQQAMSETCGAVECKDVTTPPLLKSVGEMMRSLGTDCLEVREIRLLAKSNSMVSFFSLKCWDGEGLQDYQLNHEINVGEAVAFKSTGKYMDVKTSVSSPKESLFGMK